MENSVVIKSNKNGITLVLDPDLDFEQLVRDICAKFANNRRFFGEVEMVLEIEGRDVSGREAAVIAEAIQLNSDITIPLIREKNELKDKRMMEMT
ncbi:MAG: septum site-determining protein MinC, partial [Lachnospiraceae bacterium]|nr:septum site-determining protein MinC [Lachnospiraceae bacterium]